MCRTKLFSAKQRMKRSFQGFELFLLISKSLLSYFMFSRIYLVQLLLLKRGLEIFENFDWNIRKERVEYFLRNLFCIICVHENNFKREKNPRF